MSLDAPDPMDAPQTEPFDPGDIEDDAPAQEVRLRRLERLVRIQATHHEHLVRQISELTVAMHNLRREIPQLMADGVVMAVGDPRTWEAARKAMRQRADKAVAGVFWSAIEAGWDKTKWLLAAVVLLWALRGPEVLLDVLRLLWRGQ